MKALASGLQTHYESDAITVAKCWRITLTDGSIYRLAKHVEAITVGAETFLASVLVGDAAVETTNELEADNMEITVLLDGAVFGAADIESGRWSNARVEIFEVNYADPAAGTNPIRRGRLGQWRLSRTMCTFEARPLQALLRQSIGRLYLAPCDVDLGTTRCGINLATFTDGIITGVTVGSVVSRAQFTAGALTQAAGWFTGGLITWTSGPNVLRPKAEIKDFALGGAITLQLPMHYNVAPGDAFTIQVGCDKTFATCQAKFDNAVNFQGFPDIPGSDRILSGK